MYFRHSPDVWRDYPELAAGVIVADGITPDARATEVIAGFAAVARQRLAGTSESQLPEVQAWRRTFARMGLKPTQYRCASESLLRRFRKAGELPEIHPLIDLCNAVSMAFAIPVAALDVSRVGGGLEVRPASGEEQYTTFGGETEHPDPGEMVFADEDGRAHARRWTNRQSGWSAVRDGTSTVLLVAEAMHDTARPDVERLVDELGDALTSIWSLTVTSARLTSASPRFDF